MAEAGSATPTPGVPAPDTVKKQEPTTQGNRRRRGPAWMRELPQWGRFKPEVADSSYELLEPNRLNAILAKYPENVQRRVREDLAHMDGDLLRLFRERDHAAKFNQNRYRKFQILYIVLAALATMVGSFQALALFSNTSAAPVWGFIETIIALIVTLLATLSSRESPLQMWMDNRRRAEQLRREYFRFLVDMNPYDTLAKDVRRRTLSRRAADINRGMDPDQQRSAN